MSEAGDSALDGVREVKLSPCGNCGKKTSQCCANCRKESFCSVVCQKAKRKQHKLICFPAKEEIGVALRTRPGQNMPKGFWVASRDIKEGEQIFTDYPLLIGPGQEETDPAQLICLGCHKIVENSDERIDQRLCGNCEWPFCGDACPGRDRHLKECESLCRLTRGNKPRTVFEDSLSWHRDRVLSIYKIIRVVRILDLVKDDPIKLQSFLDLYAPDRVQNQTADSCSDKAAAVKPYKSVCQVDHLPNDTIFSLKSAVENHGIGPFYPRKDKSEVLIYDKVTRVDKSCMGNCYVWPIPISKMKGPHGIALGAAKSIKKGERLSFTLRGKSNWDGTKRTRETHEDIGFLCKCTRCSDPTEFGSNVSAIKCTKCDSGLLLPLDSLDDNSEWKCNADGCKGLFPASDVDKVLQKVQSEADTLTALLSSGGDYENVVAVIDPVLEFVKKYEKILNPHHYILLNVQELIFETCTFINFRTVRLHMPYSQGLSQKIDWYRRTAEMILHVESKISQPLSHHLLTLHFYVGMSKFFSAQQAVRNEERIDVVQVQDWLKQGISQRRFVSELEIKMSLLHLEGTGGQTLTMCMGSAYENALELCRFTPNYSGIPEKMFEFGQNLCTAAVPTPTVEDN